MPGEEMGVKLSLNNRFRSQKHFAVRFILPEGWTYSGKRDIQVKHMGNIAVGEYRIKAGDTVDAKNRVIIEITCDGHADVTLIPLLILG